MKTRRERIVAELESRSSMNPTAISEMLIEHGTQITPAEAVQEVKEIAKGTDVLVAPPECRSSGFDGFDQRANIPSRCPECHAERIREPEFTIEPSG